LVHGDLFRDNVLWHGDAIVALLDFESACEGPFVYDLMVCVLAWCYASGFNLEHVAGLVRGYESVRPLSTLERSAAKVEGAIACARFATTRITDFEMRAAPGRPPLRDYRRFIGRLSELEGGALDAIFS
jgi:homoserine kinase type II